VTIRMSSGGWSFTINDPVLRVSKSGLALTWREIPQELEALILDDMRPWKAFKDALPIAGSKKTGQGG
jgi:hypothetical protein